MYYKLDWLVRQILKLFQRPLRPVHTRELAPETRSRVSTPTSTHEGACSWNTLPQSKFQYTRGSLFLKQNRATDLPLEFAPSYQTSLIWGSKTREQKFCCATYFFARNRLCRGGSFAPGACCRSVLREQAPSCVPALKENLWSLRSIRICY